MPSVIERAASGRAKCRTCGQAIARGELRFGEALPSAYGEGETLFWFHVSCAACSRPDSLLPVLEQGLLPADQREREEPLAREGIAEPRLCRILRAERASSGRARCRHCRDVIALGAWRIALQMFEEGRFTPIGTIHAECAVAYLGKEPARERFTLPCNELGTAELEEALRAIREGASRPVQPGVAKTSGDDAARAALKSS